MLSDFERFGVDDETSRLVCRAYDNAPYWAVDKMKDWGLFYTGLRDRVTPYVWLLAIGPTSAVCLYGPHVYQAWRCEKGGVVYPIWRAVVPCAAS
jgi:hypothetical protein